MKTFAHQKLAPRKTQTFWHPKPNSISSLWGHYIGVKAGVHLVRGMQATHGGLMKASWKVRLRTLSKISILVALTLVVSAAARADSFTDTGNGNITYTVTSDFINEGT